MRWQQKDRDTSFIGGDPYFHLRTGEAIPKGFAAPEPSEECPETPPVKRPIVALLPKGITVVDFAEKNAISVPSFYIKPSRYLQGARYCTALVQHAFLQSLKSEHSLSRITVLPPIDPPSISHQSPPSDPDQRQDMHLLGGQATQGTVVMGIIDYGIAFAHERFRSATNTTRIKNFWVQDAPVDQQVHNLPKVNPVPYGREINETGIGRWLSKDRLAQDEDTLYHRAASELGQRWLRSVSRRIAHGTHVMDLACGYDLSEEDKTNREQRPIVCVQLPEAAVVETSGENLDAYVLDAIRYILDRADTIARENDSAPLPVVINISYGNVAGTHDGTSDLEAAMDELLRLRRNIAPLAIVLPSGNSHLGRLHAVVDFPRPEPDSRADDKPFDPTSQELHWRVLPDDRTPSFLEIWLPKPSGNKKRTEETFADPQVQSPISLSIKPPGSTMVGVLTEPPPNAGLLLLSDEDEVLCKAGYHYVDEPTGRGMFLIALQPTRHHTLSRPEGAANPVAPSGVWTVTLKNVGLNDGRIEAWIQRDDTPYGFPRRGRQSYFDESCYRRFDHGGRVIEDDQANCIIKRDGSINAIATGRETIVIGGCLGKENEVAMYSAGGPISSSKHRNGPEALAVSDNSKVHRGVLAAGTRSGSIVALNGTSVAAPQVARSVADRFALRTGRVLVERMADESVRQVEQVWVDQLGPPQRRRERVGAGRIQLSDVKHPREGIRRQRVKSGAVEPV